MDMYFPLIQNLKTHKRMGTIAVHLTKGDNLIPSIVLIIRITHNYELQIEFGTQIHVCIQPKETIVTRCDAFYPKRETCETFILHLLSSP